MHQQRGFEPVTSLRGHSGGRGVNLQDDCDAGHGSVLVQGDLLAGLDVRPVGGSQRHEANSGSSAELENGHVLDPE